MPGAKKEEETKMLSAHLDGNRLTGFGEDAVCRSNAGLEFADADRSDAGHIGPHANTVHILIGAADGSQTHTVFIEETDIFRICVRLEGDGEGLVDLCRVGNAYRIELRLSGGDRVNLEADGYAGVFAIGIDLSLIHI